MPISESWYPANVNENIFIFYLLHDAFSDHPNGQFFLFWVSIALYVLFSYSTYIFHLGLWIFLELREVFKGERVSMYKWPAFLVLHIICLPAM